MTGPTVIENTRRERPRRQDKKTSSQGLALRGSTGPRSHRGKRRSRYNALKHGIFAKVVLQGSVLRESKAEYLELLASLCASLQPAGGAEELLVEKLAMLAWRMARAVRAETAIVVKQTEFLREDHEAQLEKNSEGPMLQLAEASAGIARRYENPHLLRRAIQLLEVLSFVVEDRGFKPEQDEGLLERLYGGSDRREGLCLAYRISSSQADEAADGPTTEACQREFLEKVGFEIERLLGKVQHVEVRQKKELPLREESLAIPKETELDRLLRYEARLEGSFDRTLSQLERLQRMRRGQPIASPIKVELSH